MNMVFNEKHKHNNKKYHFMKLKVKSLILENAALCDEVAKIQESIQIVKEERKFLLRKLVEYQNDVDMIQNFYANEQNAVPNEQPTPKKQRPDDEEDDDDDGKNMNMAM